jgi:serine/threonine-protein kinase
VSEAASRDVVLGLAAVQARLISCEALAAAMLEHKANPDLSLGRILVTAGLLSEDSHELLELEADRIECAVEAGDVLTNPGFDLSTISPDDQRLFDAVTLFEMAASFDAVTLPAPTSEPDDFEALTLAQVDVGAFNQATLPQTPPEPPSDDFDAPTEVPVSDTSDDFDSATLVQPGVSGSPPGSEPRNQLAPDADRFRVLFQHAEGGLGRVLVAMDTQLNRRVAFKQIRPQFSRNRASQTRFLVEAEVTGRLEHPGIVPVYALGRAADGSPFYAMRFIRGDSLRAAIRKFHKSRENGRRRPLAIDLEFRNLLHRIVDVCDTLEYAHSRGVLHRDIKPENIMLGRYGETLVVDWGIVRLSDEGDTPDVDKGDSRLYHNGVFAKDTQHTLEGSVVGTPAYMSPEQAAGDLQILSPASDVYGVGATLYELLTGRAPIPGDDTNIRLTELLKRVKQGIFRPPRELNPDVPSAMNAICLKAMARPIDQRYPTTRSLADDLEAWLADEPVRAWREPTFLRLRRWVSRHSMFVSGLGTAAAVGLVTFVIAFMLARQARTDALRNFRNARATVDASLTGISEALSDFPELQEDLLRQAAEQYEELAHDHSDDPEIQIETARARIRLGHVRLTLNDVEAARKEAASAVTALEELRDGVVAARLSRDVNRELARARLLSALVQQRAGDLDAAQRQFSQAIEQINQMIDRPAAPSDILLLGEARIRFAELLRETGKAKDAHSLLDLAREDVSRDMDDENSQQLQRLRAVILSGLADVLIDLDWSDETTGQTNEAAERAREAIRIWTELTARADSEVKDFDGLARARNLLLAALDPIVEEQARFDICYRLIDDLNRLMDRLPNSPRFPRMLALTRTNLAQILKQRGQNPEALDQTRESLSLLSDLLFRRYDRDTRAESIAARTMLAKIILDLGETEAALIEFDAAVENSALLVKEFPDVVRYREDQAVLHSNLGRARHRAGQTGLARESFETALAGFNGLSHNDGEVPEWLLQAQASTWTGLGDLLLETDSEAATDAYKEALRLGQLSARSTGNRLRLARFLCHCPVKTLRDPGRALQIARKINAESPELVPALSVKGAAHVRLLKWDQAIEAFEDARLKRTWPVPDVVDEFLLAIACWQRDGNAGADRKRAIKLFALTAKLFQDTQSGRRESRLLYDEARRLIDP